jgi:hypothetical protein
MLATAFPGTTVCNQIRAHEKRAVMKYHLKQQQARSIRRKCIRSTLQFPQFTNISRAQQLFSAQLVKQTQH